MAKSKKGEISVEEKLKALEILTANNYNLSETQRLTGYTRNSLREWQKKWGSKPVVFNKQEEILTNIAAQVLPERVKVLQKVEEASVVALERAIVLLKDEKDLNVVTNFITALSTISESTSPGKSNQSTTIAEKIERLTTIRKDD